MGLFGAVCTGLEVGFIWMLEGEVEYLFLTPGGEIVSGGHNYRVIACDRGHSKDMQDTKGHQLKTHKSNPIL